MTKSTVSFRKSPFLFVRSSPEQMHFSKTSAKERTTVAFQANFCTLLGKLLYDVMVL